MRDYSKTAPTFWTGDTGRQIRSIVSKDLKAGRDVQVVSFYLFTCPSSNWIGLYYLPLPILCHEVGISREGALKALKNLSSIDYAHYDEVSELVWVPGSAKFQIGESLKAGDNRIKGIVKDLQVYVKHAFAKDFYDRYAALYHLPEITWPTPSDKPLRSPLQAPSKPVTETEAVIGTETEAELIAQTSDESAPAAELFTTLPCVGKQKEFPVTRAYITEMKDLYPGIDMEKETLRAKGWLVNNPKKRKTYDGMTRFLGSWYSRVQNDGGNGNGVSPKPTAGNFSGPAFNPADIPDYAK